MTFVVSGQRRFLRQHANHRSGVEGLSEHWDHQRVVGNAQREAAGMDEI